MKIPIKINGQKFNIKPIQELTTAEFLELTKIENLDTVKYISWQTKQKLEDSFFAVTSKSVEQAIGQIPDVSKMKPCNLYDYTKLIDTVGQRHQIESCGLVGFELLVYCLAVSQARSNNSDHVQKLYNCYLVRPFIEVLPSGFFFFKNYKAGRKKGLNLLSWLRGLTNMLKIKKRRA